MSFINYNARHKVIDNRSRCFFITESFSLDNSNKTTSWVTSICSRFCCKEFIVGITFIIDNNIKMYIFSHKTCYLTTVLMLLSHRVSINFFFLTHFLFFFLRTFYLTFFWTHFTYHLPFCFLVSNCFLFFFDCSECWLRWAN